MGSWGGASLIIELSVCSNKTQLARFDGITPFFSNKALRDHLNCNGVGLLFQPLCLLILLKKVSR